MTAWAANMQMPGKKFKNSFEVRTVSCDSEKDLGGIKVFRRSLPRCQTSSFFRLLPCEV